MNGAATLELPDDPILLKQIIAQRDAVILQRDSALALCDVHIEQVRQEAAAALARREAQLEQVKREAAGRIEAMTQQHKAELAAVLRRFYGPKSEKFDPRQLLIFGLAAAEQIPVDEKVVEAETGGKLKTRRVHHKHGRRKLPDHLPRIEIPHDLSDEQKPCPCCGEMRACIGSEVSEQLEFVSASFQVLKHVRHKYACKGCGQGCANCDGQAQADAYGGYDGIFTSGMVIEVACWAHARRKFFEAKETDGRRGAQMLEMVRRLYAVEDQAREQVAKLTASQPEATAGQRHALIRSLRQEKSVPILAEIKTWLDAEKELVLPRSPMGGAIGYVLNQWEALNRYVEQGYLNIDNNVAERAVKRVAIGRKNWLFAGHDESGASHAGLWSLIASAERHGLDPQRYLTGVLARIGQAKLSELEQFLPDVWKADLAAEAAGAPSTGTPSQLHKLAEQWEDGVGGTDTNESDLMERFQKAPRKLGRAEVDRFAGAVEMIRQRGAGSV